MLVKDHLAKIIKEESGVVFGVTGGCCVSIFDALYKEGIELIPMMTEQAAAMAADGFSRVSGKIGCCVVTSGPGATNLITGTCCSYYDSIPVLNISGQVSSKHLKQNHNKNLRQFGFQETDVNKIFKSITKKSELIKSSYKFPEKLRKSIITAKQSRPGPVILDLPDDIQRQEIKNKIPIEYTISATWNLYNYTIKNIKKLISNSKRPLIILGHGIQIGKCVNKTINLIEQLNIPVLLTWGALDILDYNHKLNCGNFGITSERIGNFALQNSDLILILGSKIDTHQIPDYKIFNNKKVIMIDIDKNELDKMPNNIIKINIDLHNFINCIFDLSFPKTKWGKWLNNIQNLRKKHPIYNDNLIQKYNSFINPYHLIDHISKIASKDHIIITDAGQTLTWTMQGWKIKQGQRLFTSFNHSPMGYSLPAAIGAYYGSGRPVICFIGDGGLQMCIQNLETIAHNKLPIKIFVLNNNGYGMIRQTQSDWNSLNKGVMCGTESRLTFPNLKKISHAYNIKYYNIFTLNENISIELEFLNLNFKLKDKDPFICEIMLKDGEIIQPKLKFGDEITNQRPYLSTKEINNINKQIIKGCS
jgi:acetolactate synthase-1/2/3 large subunit